MQANFFLDLGSSWEEVHEGFVCVQEASHDGVVAESFSGQVGWLLARRWETIRSLLEISERDPSFLPFVIRHVDMAVSSDELDAIRANAQTRCPAGASDLCNSLRDAVASVDARIEREEREGKVP